MSRKAQLTIISLLIFILAVVGVITAKNKNEKETTAEQQALKEARQEKIESLAIATGIDETSLKEQDTIEDAIITESANSTLENPFVSLDPYGNSPLSALVIFNTEEAVQVAYTVKGKTEDRDITQTIEGYTIEHELPILGLYADYENTVVITTTTANGETAEKTITIQTEALPESVGTITIEEIDEDEMEYVENGLTFIVPSTKYAIGYDNSGDIRWYRSGYSSHVFQILDNGHLLFLGKDDNSGSSYNRLFETDFLGKAYNIYTINEGAAVSEQEGMDSTVVHHDAVELPSGNLLLTVNDGSGVYVEDTMIEIDRETGEIVNAIDLKDILPEEFYTEYDSTTREDGLIDWFHQNSVVYDESDNSIIISGRHQDTVMKLDYETNGIIWILSDHEGWPEEYEQFLITGVGDDFKYQTGQHAALLLDDQDDNGKTADILLFDNNIAVTRGDEEVSGTYSQAAQYRINEETLEAELVWTYGEELGEDYFSRIVSSARYMETTGNRLINFGFLQSGTETAVMEVDDSEEANVVFKAVYSDFPYGAWGYRSERFSLFPENYTYSVEN